MVKSCSATGWGFNCNFEDIRQYMKEILQKLTSHLTLDREEARNILKKIALGEYNNSQISAFLTVYMMRMITVHELAGFRDALLDLCQATDLSEFDTIDLCGTGGDGKNTFNISTLSSFVVAGAGGKVAKHGKLWQTGTDRQASGKPKNRGHFRGCSTAQKH